MRWFSTRYGVILIVVLLVAGCGGPSASSEDPTTTPPSPLVSETTVVVPSLSIEVVYPGENALVETSQWGWVPADLVDVLLVEGTDRQVADDLAESIGGEVVGFIEPLAYFQIRTEADNESELTAVIDAANANPDVESAFPELPLTTAAETSCTAQGPLEDPWFTGGPDSADDKPYQLIGLESAWAAIRASGLDTTPVKVGVIDTSLYTGSDEISGSVRISGATPADSTGEPARNSKGELRFGGLNHGTGVAHVIGADASNGGMVGVASVLGDKLQISVSNVMGGPEWSEVTPDTGDLSQTGSGGTAWTSAVLAAILSQVESGATVINLSLTSARISEVPFAGFGAYRRLLRTVAKTHPRVVFVAAAGNRHPPVGLDGTNQSPGGMAIENLITVGAVDSDGTAADFSNFAVEGGEVTIAAPGVHVPVGIGADGKPYHSNGTSFSAPMVAGAVALLQSLNPELTAAQIKDILRATGAEVVTGDKVTTIPAELGGRLLRVDQALFRTVNEMRVRAGAPPLDVDQIEALTGLFATATSSQDDNYAVTGHVGAVGKDGTDLVLAVLSDGSITGNARQSLAVAGSVSWDVVLDGGYGSLSVHRTDINVGCVLTLEPPSIDGAWSGEMVVGKVDVLGDEVELDLDGGEPVLMTKEECEALFAASPPEPIPIQYNFASTTPGAGTVNGVAGDLDSAEAASGSWISTGEFITFEMAAPGEDSAITFEGVVGDTLIEGTWETSTEDLVITGTFSMSRAG